MLIFGMEIGMNEKNKAYQKDFAKNSHLGKWAILGPEMTHPHDSGSAVRIFSKFCTMKEADR